MYVVLKQFIPGNDQIWVAKLNPDDPEYIYPTEQEAIDKAAELQAADPNRRQYKAAPYGEI
jgi:hypothetical protein